MEKVPSGTMSTCTRDTPLHGVYLQQEIQFLPAEAAWWCFRTPTPRRHDTDVLQ